MRFVDRYDYKKLPVGEINCAYPAIFAMSVKNSGPNFLDLSFGAL
jgi:hypothetical protein